jgi:hypothetical protein
MWLEGLGQLKNPLSSLGIYPITFWLVAWSMKGGGEKLSILGPPKSSPAHSNQEEIAFSLLPDGHVAVSNTLNY